MTTDTATVAAEYGAARARDWDAFLGSPAPLPDRWARWREASHDWRQEIAFLQPTGLELPSLLDPLQPLLDALAKLDEIDLPPREFLHIRTLRLGWLMSSDVMWSQVESFYVNAAPRIHRVEPFTLRFRGVSASEDALYIGVEDGHAFREVRRQIRLGVPKAAEALRSDPAWSPEGDRFIPRLEFAFFTGRGDRSRIAAAVEPYRDAELGEQPVTHIKMGRISSDPDIHYPPVDVIAEIGLLGKHYRKGYHN